jgi:hypothetical protein
MDHHRSKGNHFVDWEAAWRNWVRNAVKFARPAAMAGTALLQPDARVGEFREKDVPQPPKEELAALDEELAIVEREKKERWGNKGMSL